MSETPLDRSAQDVGNILAMEHVNVTVPDQELASLFYVSGLGFTRDPYIDFGTRNMWVNVGSQQFHLPKREAQVVRGVIGVVVPDLDAVRARMSDLAEHYGDRLDGTEFACEPGPDGTLSVTCPWGNRLRVHGAAADAFGGLTLGVPYVEIDVGPGAADAIVRFYDQIFGAPARLIDRDGAPMADVSIGCNQRLRFVETDVELAPYDGHHVAVYLANFSSPYAALAERGLITADTRDHEYRFCDIVDPDDGTVVATLEHEVRSMFNPMFDRRLVNRNPDQNNVTYRSGHDAHIGVTNGGRG